MNKVFAATAVINEKAISLEGILVDFMNYVLPVISAIAVGAIMYAGVLYLISQGDPEKLAKAKKALLWSIVGIIIVVLSTGIVVGLNSIINTEIIK